MILEPPDFEKDSVDLGTMLTGGFMLLVAMRDDGSFRVSRSHRSPRKRTKLISAEGPTFEVALKALSDELSALPFVGTNAQDQSA